MSETTWSLVLLGLRVAICVALYLFLVAAFRTLRAELRRAPSSAPALDEPLEAAAVPAVAAAAAPIATSERAPAPVAAPAPTPVAASMPHIPSAPVSAAPPARPREPRRALATRRVSPSPLRNALIVLLPLLVLGGAAVAAASQRVGQQEEQPPATAGAPNPTPAAPAAPAPGRVSVDLVAQEDSGVRVTVDNVVQFNGVLRAGQHQRWEGGSAIQVWTDKGKTLLLAVNGHELGPYSPAMDRPDWNRIEYAFRPGWRPSRDDDDD